MKKFLLSLAIVAFAASVSMAQAPVKANAKVIAPKHEKCEGHMDGKVCDKPADQQCDDCKAKAAEAKKHECKEGMHKCDKAEGMKHECKEGQKHECKEGQKHECKEGMKPECKEGMKHECKEGPKHECKEGMKHECKEGMKPECKEGMKHECKEGEGKQCDKGAIKKMHEECKDHKDGQPCTKPADQQCPDCKEKAAAKKN